jgi:hypothetical protein
MALPVQNVIFNCRNGISSDTDVADGTDAGTFAPLDFLGWAKPCVPDIRMLRRRSGIDRLAKEKKILMVVIVGTPNDE